MRDDQRGRPEADHGLREQTRACDAARTPRFGEAARRRRTQAQEQGGGEQRGQDDEPVDEESHNEEKWGTRTKRAHFRGMARAIESDESEIERHF
ncbi:hypothetical protein BURCENBC7_AP6036 [Burkholderia cenocepacia BC7]|nr:hypothetical protein BURCENBC7_AP6036 [Burkholderia cenocepacia BC7]